MENMRGWYLWVPVHEAWCGWGEWTCCPPAARLALRSRMNDRPVFHQRLPYSRLERHLQAFWMWMVVAQCMGGTLRGGHVAAARISEEAAAPRGLGSVVPVTVVLGELKLSLQLNDHELRRGDTVSVVRQICFCISRCGHK